MSAQSDSVAKDLHRGIHGQIEVCGAHQGLNSARRARQLQLVCRLREERGGLDRVGPPLKGLDKGHKEDKYRAHRHVQCPPEAQGQAVKTNGIAAHLPLSEGDQGATS